MSGDELIYLTIAVIAWAVAFIAFIYNLCCKDQVSGDDVAAAFIGPIAIGGLWPIWIFPAIITGLFEVIAHIVNKVFKRASTKSQ